MDQAANEWKISLEINSFLEHEFEFDQLFAIENPETSPGLGSERVTEAMDSNKNIVDVVPDVQSKYKTGIAMSKIQNDKTEMTVASVPERKTLKRKAASPPTSKMVTDFIKALKKHDGVLFEDVSKYMQDKYGVNSKLLRYHLGKFLKSRVGNGKLKKIEERSRPRKKMAATKKQVKK